MAKCDWKDGSMVTLARFAAAIEGQLKTGDPKGWETRKAGLVAGLNLALAVVEHFDQKPKTADSCLDEARDALIDMKNYAFNNAGLAALLAGRE